MFTNNINARKMLSEVFAYQSPPPAPAPGPKAPRGKARAVPAQVEETFESDSESSYQGSVRSASSIISVDDVPPPPVGSAAPRVGPTKSAKNKKSTAKQMAKPKVEKPLPPPAAPVLKVEAAAPAPEKVKVSRKKLTAPPAPAADLPPVKVDLPAKIVLAQKLEQPEKKKRAPSAYNKFVSGHMKQGLSMVAIAGLWKEQKAGKAAKD